MQHNVLGALMLVTYTHGSFDLQGRPNDVETLAASRQFQEWLARLDARFTIHGITLQALDRRRDGGLLFAKFVADVTDPHGRRVPGAVFLRGDAVAVLVVLHADGQEWTVLTVQPRFPAGLFESVEIPAGMLDDHGDFTGAAARELVEETGLQIDADQLSYLGEFFPSGGGSDELIKLYVCHIEMARTEIESLHGRLAGAAHEHERIRVKVVPLGDLPRHTSDVKALMAYGYYKGWGAAPPLKSDQ